MSVIKEGAWTATLGNDEVFTLVIDCPQDAVNTLGVEVVDALASILDRLASLPHKALIIRSGKSNGFIAGANIDQLSSFQDWGQIKPFLQKAWQSISRLHQWKQPTMAVIDGFCLGGGLELAMACRYRVAVSDGKTRLGLPEVTLGIVPAWGGMVFLPRLVGLPNALDLLLSGRTIDARRAKKMGLVDLAVPRRVLDLTVAGLLKKLPPQRTLPWTVRLMEHWPLRQTVFSRAKKMVQKKADPAFYPAPYMILTHVARYGGDTLSIPDHSPDSLARLVARPFFKGLFRVYALQERLKSIGKDLTFPPCQRLHVVGAGTMGGDLAAWAARRGLRVTLQDVSYERAAQAVQRAHAWMTKKIKDPNELMHAKDRLVVDVQGHGVASADVIVEAIVENLSAKRSLFARLEEQARPEAILATNTSSLTLEEIATALREPARLVGIHFFNPVVMMPLVEVVRTDHCDQTMFDRALAFVRQIDKLPLPVLSRPGFLVNRVLAAYMDLALRMVDEGMDPARLDASARAFGMMMGPIELADTVGLDICLAAGQSIYANQAQQPPATLMRLVKEGKLGRKTGEGFYRYEKGRLVKTGEKAQPFAQEVIDRLVRPLYVVSRQCVEEGIVADADLADAGIIFGAGFAPFRGGVLGGISPRAV